MPTSLFPAMNSPTAGSVVPCPSDSSIPGASVGHGDQVMQEASVVANGGLITTQAGGSENDDKLPSEEQHMLPLSDDEEGNCPIDITHSVASDEKQISLPARKDSIMLPPMENSIVNKFKGKSR